MENNEPLASTAVAVRRIPRNLEIIEQSNAFACESKVSHGVKSAAKNERRLRIVHSNYLGELRLVVTRLWKKNEKKPAIGVF